MQPRIEEKGEKTARTPGAEEWFRYDRMLGELGRLAIEAANIKRGSSVIDVGCGAGGSTLDAAGVVGDNGKVLGIDLDSSAITVARARARAEGFRNIDLLVGDAARHAYGAGRADAVISRLGNLFFADPVRAHLHLASSLRPGGRISFLAPRELERNVWAALPMRVVSRVLGKNTLSTAPFVLADPRRIVSVLEKAGFERVRLESIDKPLCIGADLDDAISFFAKTDGKELFASLESSQSQELLDGLTRALSPYVGERGVYMPSSVWLVSARLR
jgi:ubiquinone/menaquinone biosynthesis C-methylase UbiE